MQERDPNSEENLASPSQRPDATDDVARNVEGDAAKPQPVEGLVVALAPGLFEVVVNGVSYLCTLRGRLRKQRPLASALTTANQSTDRRRGGAGRPPTYIASGKGGKGGSRSVAPVIEPPTEPQRPTRVATGDRVLMRPLGNGEGVIEDVLPRTTTLTRMRSEVGTEQVLMANVEQAILVFSTRDPTPNFGLLDRYLALCEHAKVGIVICLNKIDLGVADDVAATMALYASLGYPLLHTSATTGEEIETLRARLFGRVSLLTGPSGVGKSSLMNAMLPDAGQRIGEISEATGKGRHTTTGARLLPFPGGGWLADTAGIRELALWNVPPDELAACFVELRPYVDDCLYEDCGHTAHDEGCALQAAFAAGRITPERFASFQKLLEEACVATPA